MSNQQKPAQPKCAAIIDGIADISPFPCGEIKAAHPTPACGAFVSMEVGERTEQVMRKTLKQIQGICKDAPNVFWEALHKLNGIKQLVDSAMNEDKS